MRIFWVGETTRQTCGAVLSKVPRLLQSVVAGLQAPGASEKRPATNDERCTQQKHMGNMNKFISIYDIWPCNWMPKYLNHYPLQCTEALCFSCFSRCSHHFDWLKAGLDGSRIYIKPSNQLVFASIATEPSGDCKEPLSFDLFSNWKQLWPNGIIFHQPRFPWNSRGFPLQFTGTRVNFVISFDQVSTSPSRLEYWESGAINPSRCLER